MLDLIKDKIKEQLSRYNDVIVETPKRGVADLAIPLFSYAKLRNEKVTDTYEVFKKDLEQLDFITRLEFVSGFLNIYLNRVYLAKGSLGEVKDIIIGNGKVVLIDYSSPNIAKSFSVGHLRSTMIGNALKNIYNALGYQVVGINHLGDWGTQFGRMIVAYQKWGNKELIEKNPIVELQKLYVLFHEQEKLDERLSEEARLAFLKLEQGNKEYLDLWQWMKDESLKEFMHVYDLLGVSFDSYHGEAFYNDKMDRVVKMLDDKGLLKLDDGATIVDLGEKYPPALIKRRDGGTLYITRDLAALIYRYETYKFDTMLYCIGNEQKLHIEQLKALSNLMGYDFDIKHINFGLVLIDGKKMSTRSGQFKKLEDIIKIATKQAKEAITQKNPDLKNKNKVAKAIGVGAIVFNDLKNERHLDIDFNLDNMLKFEGQTGPYLQYTSVRIASILRDNALDMSKVDFNIYNEEQYNECINLIASFSSNLKRAKENNAPNVVARYLLSLAQSFNKFYGQNKISVKDDRYRNTNLYFIKSIRNYLNFGLELLGLEVLDEM